MFAFPVFLQVDSTLHDKSWSHDRLLDREKDAQVSSISTYQGFALFWLRIVDSSLLLTALGVSWALFFYGKLVQIPHLMYPVRVHNRIYTNHSGIVNAV